MSKEIQQMSDDELVKESGSGINHRSQGAQAELTRRLIKALNKSSKSSDRHSKVNLVLSSALFFIGYTQTILMIFTIPTSFFIQVILFVIVIVSIYFVFNWLIKNILEISKK